MRIAAVFAMSFGLALLVLTCGALAAITYHLRHAPEAFEDETGFHFSSSADNSLLGTDADVRAARFEGQSKASRRRRTPDSIGIAGPRVSEAH